LILGSAHIFVINVHRFGIFVFIDLTYVLSTQNKCFLGKFIFVAIAFISPFQHTNNAY
jgi:hypothetical protein